LLVFPSLNFPLFIHELILNFFESEFNEVAAVAEMEGKKRGDKIRILVVGGGG
jgi:hypothetical protein